MKFVRIILFVFIFILLFAACNPSDTEVDTLTPQTETSSPTLTDTLAPTHTLTNSPTASQTSTVTPSQTATSTSTSTPTPADIVVFIIKTDWLGLRSGPGIHYELLGLYFEGAEAIVLGTDPARQWFWVQVVEDGEVGWFFGEFLSLDPSNLEFIPVVDNTPTPPPFDQKPDLTATQECKWLENKGTPCP